MNPVVDEFPRVYDPERPELAVRTYAFFARRFATGPCTVEKKIFRDGEYDGRIMVLGGVDWHGPDAQWLAREMLWKADCDNHGEIPARFVEEVLAKLPRDGWELPFEDVWAWSAKHAPPPPPPLVLPPFEDRVREKLRALGMLAGDCDEEADEE